MEVVAQLTSCAGDWGLALPVESPGSVTAHAAHGPAGRGQVRWGGGESLALCFSAESDGPV